MNVCIFFKLSILPFKFYAQIIDILWLVKGRENYLIVLLKRSDTQLHSGKISIDNVENIRY